MANEKRLIDANALIKEVESYTTLIPDVNFDRDRFYHATGFNGGLVAARVSIKDAPTVDAVEVVHCGSCRFACDETADGWMWCNSWCNSTTCDGYCHCGERKDK